MYALGKGHMHGECLEVRGGSQKSVLFLPCESPCGVELKWAGLAAAHLPGELSHRSSCLSEEFFQAPKLTQQGTRGFSGPGNIHWAVSSRLRWRFSGIS